MAFLHGRHTSLYLSEYDISGFFSDASGDSTLDTAEVSVFNDDNKQYITGMMQGSMALSGFFEDDTDINPTATTETMDKVLSDMVAAGNDELCTIVYGSSPAAGNRARVLYGHLTSANISSPLAGVTATSVNLQSDGSAVRSGYLLGDPTDAIAATEDGDTVDTAITSSALGWAVGLHVIANTRNGDLDVVVQHSDDGTTWVDLATFSTISAGNLGYQFLTDSDDTVNRYVRQEVTLGGSTGTVSIVTTMSRR